MFNGREELMDVALEDEARLRSIATHALEHPIQSIDRFVRPFTFSAGKGMGDERWLKDGIEHREDGMVQDTVLHGRFVYAPLLRIADGEGAVRVMPVRSCNQFAVQLKEILFQFPLKILHILPSLLAFAKPLPCSKEIFH